MEEHSSYGKYADLNKSLTNYAPIEVAEAIAREWGEYLEKMPVELQRQLTSAISSIRLGEAREQVIAKVDGHLKPYVEQAFELDDDSLQNLGEGVGCQQGRHVDFDYIR